jgi:VanZ family protein
VWTLSSDAFASPSTSRVLEPLVRWLWPNVPAELLLRLHHLVRKAAHLTEYAVLGVLALRALRVGSLRPVLHSAALALAFAVAVAAADEARQSRSRARTGAVSDVALDATGAALGIGGTLVVVSRSRMRR